MPSSERWSQNISPGEQDRRTRAQDLGLPSETPWHEILAREDQRERAIIAKELGWQEEAWWMAEAERLGVDPYPPWRTILTLLLNLPANAPVEDMIAKISET